MAVPVGEATDEVEVALTEDGAGAECVDEVAGVEWETGAEEAGEETEDVICATLDADLVDTARVVGGLELLL